MAKVEKNQAKRLKEKFSLARVLEVLAGNAIIVALLGWALYELYGFNSRVSKIEGLNTNLNERIDRIADGLSDYGVKIAQESLARPVRAVVVVSEPEKNDKTGTWTASLSVVDPEKQTIKKFKIETNGPNDNAAAYEVSGRIHARGWNAYFFDDASKASIAIGKPVAVPARVEAASSFMFTKPVAGSLSDDFKKVYGEPKTIKIRDGRVSDFKDLIDAMGNGNIDYNH